ncbi:MAG TPA: cytidylate kinase-like family protein, partial [Verrucomicrobiae bacterium]|nr:cytidylate kinase-like family protein [Verrucomicrobiae bacterium]
MNREADFQKGVAFINCLLPEAVQRETRKEADGFRAIAISRQSASGAHAVAEKLAKMLDLHAPKGAPAWTVFDRNLVEKVLEDHHLPDRLARFMPEDAVSHINSIMEELFGLHPPSEVLVHQTSETILRLAKLGRVILLGRAAVLVTAHLPHVLRVRLVAPLKQRIEFMQRTEGMNHKEARERVHEEDQGRKRYF